MASYISDVKKITERQTAYVINSQEKNTQSLANYLPNGALFAGKNVEGTNIRNMLSSFALEIIRKETTLDTIATQYYPFNTVDFLAEWESALRIPDDCFEVEGVSIEQRQKQIIAKLALDKLITKDDFIALAAFFGYTITITTGLEDNSFPFTFPFFLAGSEKEQKFTIIVTFKGIAPEVGFPYIFPLTFPPPDPLEFLKCYIQKLVPANVKVIYRQEA